MSDSKTETEKMLGMIADGIYALRDATGGLESEGENWRNLLASLHSLAESSYDTEQHLERISLNLERIADAYVPPKASAA